MTGKFVAVILSFFLAAPLMAEENCIHCPKRKVEGIPASGNMDSIATLPSKAVSKDSDLETKTQTFCMKYENIDADSLYSYAKEIDASPYPIDPHFTKSSL